MSGIRWIMIVALSALLLSACNKVLLQPDHASQDLATGVQDYEAGKYAVAIVLIQDALKDGLPSKNEQVRAYKYLAFIHCVSDREKQCRDAFKKALEIDPNFALTPAEAGHPVWGPVFHSVKSGFSQ